MSPTISRFFAHRSLSLGAMAVALAIAPPARGENLQHLSQLLSTGSCPQCNLVNSGLVTSDLSGADLSGANLSQANLSQANLTGANLSGANLSGTSLNGANLSGANLSGAQLYGTDLRNAYLFNANLTGVSLGQAYVQGALGIPVTGGTTEEFYGWGLGEANQGNHSGAIRYYAFALQQDSQFAPAYLGLASVYSEQGNFSQAIAYAEAALTLFTEQENPEGIEASQAMVDNLELALNPQKKGGGGIGGFLQNLGTMLLQFAL